MKSTRGLELLVIEKVMGWQYDRARTFSPATLLHNAWEMEEYLMEDPARAERYGEALWRIAFSEEKSLSDAARALRLAHLPLASRCRAALVAVGLSESEINAPEENQS